MERKLAWLANQEFDLLVVGGGIGGAAIAWDAALRGLSVALVDKGDFGHATSANSLKIIHGGLRYLQDARLPLVRAMTRERMTWLRIAPHLVQPLACLMPAERHLSRTPLAFRLALRALDLVNLGLAGQGGQLPKGRVLSRAEYSRLVPGSDGGSQLTGGLLWFDAQMWSSERLLWAVVQSAVQAGAVAANYVEARGFLRQGSAVAGIVAEDGLTGCTFDVRAKLVVNSTGAWTDEVLQQLETAREVKRYRLSIAMNLVTRQVIPEVAVGLPTVGAANGHGLRRKPVTLFIVPWQGHSLVGTWHQPYEGRPQDFALTPAMIQDHLDEVNAAYPPAALTRRDVRHIHLGFLPRVDGTPGESVRLVREGRVYDHARTDGVPGLMTAVNVKFTTARLLAERTVDLALKKLGEGQRPCRTAVTPLAGGDIEDFEQFSQQALRRRPPAISEETIVRLVRHHGTAYRQILDYSAHMPNWAQPVGSASPVIQAEVIHAVRAEMAVKLSDAVQRRTDVGAAGLPAEDCLEACARLMAGELGWSEARRQAELCEVRAGYPLEQLSQVTSYEPAG